MRLAVLSLILPLATASFVLGLTLPLLELERLYFFVDLPTLLQVVTGLWVEEERLLAGLIAAFSIVFPAVKLVALHVAAVMGRAGAGSSLLHALGRWSMMDVMLVALVVFAAKTTGLAQAASLPGMWFYGAATLLTAFGAWLAERGGR